MSLSELELDLGTAAISCTPDELAAGLSSLLREIRSVARRLRADERVALRMIMSRDSGTLTVGEVFREFSRESEAHKTLRRLRAAQFVRPAEHGRWDPSEPIEIKPFAKLLWDRLGEGEIFAQDPDEVVLTSDEPPAEELAVEPTAVAEAEPAAEEEPVAEAGAEEEPAVVESAEAEPAGEQEEAKPPKAEPRKAKPRKSETLKAEPAMASSAEPDEVEAAAAKVWEDDSVVDLADVDDFRHYVEEELRQQR